MHPYPRARINPDNPRRTALCQRCGTLYNLTDLLPQKQWAGQGVIDTGFRVCLSCLDAPNPNERTLTLRPDPPPSLYALQNSFPLDNELGLTTDRTWITVADTSITTDTVDNF